MAGERESVTEGAGGEETEMLVWSLAGQGLELVAVIMWILTKIPCVLTCPLSWTFSSSD